MNTDNETLDLNDEAESDAAFNDVVDEVREFWTQLERTLERDPDADTMADLLGEYRYLSSFIDNDGDLEHHRILMNALAIERGNQLEH